MSEVKKLRGACVKYLTARKVKFEEVVHLNTMDLIRKVAETHAIEMGTKVTVSYHFEGDNQ